MPTLKQRSSFHLYKYIYYDVICALKLVVLSLFMGVFIQISDFGLAKLMPEGKEMYVTARVLGTFGYFDPEYTSVRAFLLNINISDLLSLSVSIFMHIIYSSFLFS